MFLIECQTSVANETPKILEVPLTQQAKGPMCGPASIEMVLKFWGDYRYNQYDIAEQIGKQFAEEKRFKNSNFLKHGQAIFTDYPGTPAYIMVRYLRNWASTKKFSLKSLPQDQSILDQKFSEVLSWLKNHINKGIPIIVHQYWKGNKSTGHYRVVTGYDDDKKIVYLNDPKAGQVTQTYSEFKRKGAVKGKWLPYYSIAFNLERKSGPL